MNLKGGANFSSLKVEIGTAIKKIRSEIKSLPPIDDNSRLTDRSEEINKLHRELRDYNAKLGELKAREKDKRNKFTGGEELLLKDLPKKIEKIEKNISDKKEVNEKEKELNEKIEKLNVILKNINDQEKNLEKKCIIRPNNCDAIFNDFKSNIDKVIGETTTNAPKEIVAASETEQDFDFARLATIQPKPEKILT
jgi:chromosome segregation ATPase